MTVAELNAPLCWVIRHIPSGWYLADDDTLQESVEKAMAIPTADAADRRLAQIEQPVRADYQVMSCENNE